MPKSTQPLRLELGYKPREVIPQRQSREHVCSCGTNSGRIIVASRRVMGRSLCIHTQKVLLKVPSTQWHSINTKHSML